MNKCSKLFAAGALFFSILYGTGCSTIFGGKKVVSFESDPPGATVRSGGNVLGTTPFTKEIHGAPLLEFQLEGYQTRIVNPALDGMSEIDLWFYANILNEGIGLFVDSYTNSSYILHSPIRVSLYPLPGNTQVLKSDFYPRSSAAAGESSNSKTSSEDTVYGRLKALKELKEKGLISDTDYETKKGEILKEL